MPFSGVAGRRVFEPLLRAAGLGSNEVWVYNVLGCRPPDNDINDRRARAALDICPQNILLPAIAERKPSVIVAMGTTAVRALLGGRVRLSEVRGVPTPATVAGHACIVIPTYHPASLLQGRNPHYWPHTEWDFRRAVDVANGLPYTVEKTYSTLTTLYEALNFLDSLLELRDLLSFDIEAQNYVPSVVDVHRDKVLGLSFSWAEGEAAYLPLRHRAPLSYELQDFWEDDQPEVLARLRAVLESDIPKCGQNKINYDSELLWCDLGIKPVNIVMDTMYASHNLNENQLSHGLDEQVRIFLPMEAGWKGMAKPGDMASMPLEEISLYCCTDSDMERRLALIHQERLEAEPTVKRLFYDYTMNFGRALQAMELQGAPIDVDDLPRLRQELEAEELRLQTQMRREFGRTVKVNSTAEVMDALDNAGVDLDLLQEKNDDGLPLHDDRGRVVYKTDRYHLELAAEISSLANLILDTRAVSKLLSTYVLPIEQKVLDGWIHGNFWVHGTVAGRPSSSDPNLLNIPRGGEDETKAKDKWGKRVKGLYAAPEGWKLVGGDFSQMEVRCLAYYAGDRILAQACDTRDVHLATGVGIFQLDFDEAYRRMKAGDPEIKEMRQAAKTVTFQTVYGGSAPAAAKLYHLEVEVVERFAEGFFSTYADVTRWVEMIHHQIDKYKYIISVFGRVRRIPYAGEKGLVGRAHRQAVNSIIQGTASDICGRALIRILNRLMRGGFRSRLVLTVYDSIIAVCPDSEVNDVLYIMYEEMTRKPLADFEVPLRVDIGVGQRWSTMNPVVIAA